VKVILREKEEEEEEEEQENDGGREKGTYLRVSVLGICE
jgi:hypothetical protein